MTELKEQMEQLYQQMYELTNPECHNCLIKHSCCDSIACDLATARAAEFGVTLTPTGHDKLPYMGEQGCVVPPYLRPLCTLHTCEISSLGFKRDDPNGEWTAEYFDLREQINVLELEWYSSQQQGESEMLAEVNSAGSEPMGPPFKSPQQRGAERRRTIPTAERKRLVAEYLLSGMTQRDFVKERDLALSSFGNWVRKYRDKLQAKHEAQQQLPIPTKGTHAMTGTVTTAKVHNDQLAQAQQRIAELEEQVRKLRDRNKSLHRAVEILGFQQLGDDE